MAKVHNPYTPWRRDAICKTDKRSSDRTYDTEFANARRRADEYNFERDARQALKEVWDD